MRITRMQATGVLMILTMIGLTGCANAVEEPLRVPTSTSGESAAGGGAAGGVTDSPSAVPSVLPSPGADPEADVAAAIAVYEAYVAASNEIVVADRETWDPALALLQDPYLTETIAGYEELASRGATIEGDVAIVSAVSGLVNPTIIRLDVCADYSDSTVIEADGKPGDRGQDNELSSVNVLLEADADSSFGWMIAHIGWAERECR